MAAAGYATSTIHHTGSTSTRRACTRSVSAVQSRIRRPTCCSPRPDRPRKSFTVEQLERLLIDAIPQDARPAVRLTGLMCGLRPGELAGYGGRS
jgi:hypothetical protein